MASRQMAADWRRRARTRGDALDLKKKGILDIDGIKAEILLTITKVTFLGRGAGRYGVAVRVVDPLHQLGDHHCGGEEGNERIS